MRACRGRRSRGARGSYRAGSRAAILRGPISATGGSGVSKQDTHFFNVFSLVIGLLMTIAILLFAVPVWLVLHFGLMPFRRSK